jgi:hypothetical protein
MILPVWPHPLLMKLLWLHSICGICESLSLRSILAVWLLCIMAAMLLVADHWSVDICCLLHQIAMEVLGRLCLSSRFAAMTTDGNMVVVVVEVLHLFLLVKNIDCRP